MKTSRLASWVTAALAINAALSATAEDKVCFMCDGDVDAKAMVTVPTEKGNVNLCSAQIRSACKVGECAPR